MSADFAHALDDGQAEYRDAAGGSEALARVIYEAATDAADAQWDSLRRIGAAGLYFLQAHAILNSTWLADLLTAERARTAAAIRAEADRICAQRGCHVAGNDHAELMKWAGVFAGVVERGES